MLKRLNRQNREKKLADEYYEVVREQGRDYLRYLKPIVAGKMCLKCHGQPDQIPPQVMAVLKEKYPTTLRIAVKGTSAGDLCDRRCCGQRREPGLRDSEIE